MAQAEPAHEVETRADASRAVIAEVKPAPLLSVVIPMYRESRRIGRTLDELVPALVRSPRPVEVVLVDDGSDDETIRVVASYLSDEPTGSLARVALVRHERNRGKGAAIRTGLAAARGHWRLIMDADNSTRIDQAEKLVGAAAGTGAALAAGSRAAPGSDVRTRAHRKLMGAAFRAALSMMGLRLLRDTQCGFKLYRADAADLVARLGREDGFAFDIEHLLLLRSAGATIVEVGVEWTHADAGTVRPMRDGVRMLRRAWALRGTRAPEGAMNAGAAGLAMAAIEAKPIVGVASGSAS